MTYNDFYVNSDKANNRGRLLRAQRGDSADEIDPRRLVRDPTLSEIRWYYRRTFAKILVNKPIDDAFKNGFELNGRDAEWSMRKMAELDFLQYYKLCEKKARRDGFALLFIGTKDNTAGVEYPLFRKGAKVEPTHLRVLTVDDLKYVDNLEIKDVMRNVFGYDHNQYSVRRTGIVVGTDISDENYGVPLGYVLGMGGGKVQFIHRDRVLHRTWNTEVDGDYSPDTEPFGVRRWRHERPLGQYEGDSVLIPSYDLIKGLTKGNWSIMQALFRNASNMYAIHLPSDADEEEAAFASNALTNINAKSELILPRGQAEDESYKVEQFKSGNIMNPRDHYDVIFDQICAAHEMTKSVLFGTQSGVVSGSETDIKNYFNQVQRNRTDIHEVEIIRFLNMLRRMEDGRAVDAEVDVTFEWGPLFKLSQQDKIGAFLSHANAMTIMINGYMLTPDEARNILSEEWAEIDLGALTEEQRDLLDRINLTQVGAYEGAQIAETERGEQKEVGNGTSNQRQTPGSGMQQGQTTGEMSNMDAMLDDIADEIVERVLQKLTEGNN